MASIDNRKGNWRAQVRRNCKSLFKTFRMKADAEGWARDVELSIDLDVDPTTTRLHCTACRSTCIRFIADERIDDPGSRLDADQTPAATLLPDFKATSPQLDWFHSTLPCSRRAAWTRLR